MNTLIMQERTNYQPRQISSKAILLALSILSVHLGEVAAQNQLLLPDTVSGGVIDLELGTGTMPFLLGPLTQTMGVNGPLLGPTIILQQGQTVTMNVSNQLGEPSTIHWHGMHVPPEADGGPHTPIAAGDTWSPSFAVLERASTHWYHPHLHMHTNEQVVKGIAGLIIVRDPLESALALPRTYGVDDIPLVLQTKQFDANNQVVVGDALDTHVLVNGTLDPYVDVPGQVVRLRLLNGASERVLNLGLTGNHAFHQIGTDGGLLAAPVQLTRLRLAPGERAEVLVDLSALQGQSIELVSFASELPSAIYGAAQPGMGAGQTIPNYTLNPLNGNDFSLLQINVGPPTPNPITSIPGTLAVLTPWAEASANTTRTFTFTPVNMGPTAIQGPFLINGASFDMMNINFDVPLDNIEVWELTNQSPIAHPFHIHDVQFYILDINGATPPPNMQGRKDVVLVPAGIGTVRFITRFEDYSSYDMPYMYHCHMLPHEDDGMMGHFRVLPQDAGILDGTVPNGLMQVLPNPASTFLDLNLDPSLGLGEITITDLTGRVVMMRNDVSGFLRLDVQHYPLGSYLINFRGASGTSTVRFMRS
ncbi:MAG: multicopper oxidase domain-containing protein [Flavobacteriales bacterium]|nr:multicopper oxidase domain-containing protein [Flavobacteriales bacterium]MBP7451093.1 multicopper oxidase domain-containing protein [Flavobacteriales bacterium]